MKIKKLERRIAYVVEEGGDYLLKKEAIQTAATCICLLKNLR